MHSLSNPFIQTPRLLWDLLTKPHMLLTHLLNISMKRDHAIWSCLYTIYMVNKHIMYLIWDKYLICHPSLWAASCPGCDNTPENISLSYHYSLPHYSRGIHRNSQNIFLSWYYQRFSGRNNWTSPYL